MEPLLVGWREWVALPDLGIHKLKVKVDTGARTSALHAFQINYYEEKEQPMVCFAIHPRRGHPKVIECRAPVIDQRWVTDSGGHREERYVIQTTIVMAGNSWPIEITLTNRDDMRFRMLLGRTAMKNRLIVDPAASFLLGKNKI